MITSSSILERLIEAGLIEPQGIKKGRTYTLSASIYRQLGQSADYIHQVGFDRIQQEQMVIQYIQKHGRIKRKDVMDLCRLSRDQARRLLQHMLAEEKIIAYGQSRGTHYTIL